MNAPISTAKFMKPRQFYQYVMLEEVEGGMYKI